MRRQRRHVARRHALLQTATIVVAAACLSTACAGGTDGAAGPNSPAAPNSTTTATAQPSATQTPPSTTQTPSSKDTSTTRAGSARRPKLEAATAEPVEEPCPAIGLLAPGPDAAGLAEGIRNGIELALSEDVPCPITLVESASGASVADAQRAAGELIADESVVGVIGPMLGWEAEAVGPMLDESGIAALSPTVSDPVVGDLHRATADAEALTAATVELISTRFSADTVVLLDDGTDYGKASGDRIAGALATQVVWRGSMTSGATSPERLAADAVAATPAAVVVNGFYRDTARLVAALRAAAYTGPIVLDDGSYTDAFIAAAGPAADQTYILCGCAPADIDPRFADRYAAKFGAPPPIYAAEAYDLTRALIATLSAGARDRIGVADRLSVMSHSGVTKRYSWMPTGELESAPVYVVTPRSVDGELRFVGDGIVTVTDP